MVIFKNKVFFMTDRELHVCLEGQHRFEQKKFD